MFPSAVILSSQIILELEPTAALNSTLCLEFPLGVHAYVIAVTPRIIVILNFIFFVCIMEYSSFMFHRIF